MILFVQGGNVVSQAATPEIAAAVAAMHPGAAQVDVTPATLAALQTHAVNSVLPDPRAAGVLTWDDIRLQRAPLIAASDYTEGVGLRAKKGAVWAAAWDAYRNALRDLPQTAGLNPNTLTWPMAPTA